jgi:hypothetical protein
MNTNVTTTKTSRKTRVGAALLGSFLLAGTIAACGNSPEHVGTSKPSAKPVATASRSAGMIIPNRADGPLAHRMEVHVTAGVPGSGGVAAVAPNPSTGPLMHRTERGVAAAEAAVDSKPTVAPNPAVGPLQHRLDR